MPTVATAAVLLSAGALYYAAQHPPRAAGRLKLGLAAGFVLTAAVVAAQAVGYTQLDSSWQVNAYRSIFYTLLYTLLAPTRWSPSPD